MKTQLCCAVAVLVALTSGAAAGQGPSSEKLEVDVVADPLLSDGAETQLGESTIEQEALQKPGQSTAEALRSVPGVQVARQGAPSDFATASIRGATSAQTPVYLAGIRLNDDVVGSADVSAIPLWMLRRVRVYRGHAPLRVARLAIGGAIVAEPILPGRSQARIEVERGSFGHYGSHGLLALGSAKSSALLGVRYATARNDFRFQDDNGTLFVPSDDRVLRRSNADYTTKEAWALGRQLLGPVRIRYLVSALEREQGLSGTSLQPAEHARLGLRRGLAGLSLTWACRDAARCGLHAGAQASWSGLQTRDPYREIPALLSERFDVYGRRFSERMGGWYRPFDALELDLRLRHNYSAVELIRDGAAPKLARRHSGRALIRAKWAPIGSRFTAEFLAAGECHNTTAGAEAPGCGVLAPTGRVASSWRFSPKLSLHSGMGRYLRMPTLGELFGTSTLIRGNSALRPESAWSGDLGVRYRLERRNARAALELFGFARWTQDAIVFRQTSLGIVSPANLAQARILGAEAQAAARLFQRWGMQATATLLDPRALGEGVGGGNDRLPYRSAVVARLATQYELPLPLEPDDSLVVGVSYLHRSARFADAAGLVRLPAQESVDAELNWHLLRRRLQLRMAVHNMTDNQMVDLLSAPLPGRRYSMALRWRWTRLGTAPGRPSVLAPTR